MTNCKCCHSKATDCGKFNQHPVTSPFHTELEAEAEDSRQPVALPAHRHKQDWKVCCKKLSPFKTNYLLF